MVSPLADYLLVTDVGRLESCTLELSSLLAAASDAWCSVPHASTNAHLQQHASHVSIAQPGSTFQRSQAQASRPILSSDLCRLRARDSIRRRPPPLAQACSAQDVLLRSRLRLRRRLPPLPEDAPVRVDLGRSPATPPVLHSVPHIFVGGGCMGSARCVYWESTSSWPAASAWHLLEAGGTSAPTPMVPVRAPAGPPVPLPSSPIVGTPPPALPSPMSSWAASHLTPAEHYRLAMAPGYAAAPVPPPVMGGARPLASTSPSTLEIHLAGSWTLRLEARDGHSTVSFPVAHPASTMVASTGGGGTGAKASSGAPLLSPTPATSATAPTSVLSTLPPPAPSGPDAA